MLLLMKLFFVVLFLHTILSVSIENKNTKQDNLIINIENGPIRGRSAKTVNMGTQYYAFQSIPYAEPPVGDLRFEPPIPSRNWSKILNTTQDPNPCVQSNFPIIGSEDCLYLNVFSPNLLAETPFAVMVWIHGGAFHTGDSNYSSFSPDYFLESDVIVVTLNYRLGIFGFFSTENLIVPGNMGLKDQLLALKWVKNNIDKFGGNPEKVTIFGESSGAASAAYHLQSELSKGLFQGAIMQSGTSLCEWALYKDQITFNNILESYLHLNSSNTRRFVADLKKMDYKSVQNISYQLFVSLFETTLYRGGIVFGPVIEPEHEGAFLSNKSFQLLESGQFYKVSVILGFNSMEALYNLNDNMLSKLNLFNKYAFNLVPRNMGIKEQAKTNSAGIKINKYYFGNSSKIPDLKMVFQFLSDDLFNRPIQKTVALISKFSPVYYYKFSYEGEFESEAYKKPFNISGVMHTEELNYLWHNTILKNTKTNNLIREIMVKFWTNFAKFGSPSPKNSIWPKVSDQKGKLLLLNIDKKLSVKNYKTKYLKFWDNLYNKYGNPPYFTY